MNKPEPVLSPAQHARLMTLMREKPALTQEDINAGHAYAAKRWAEYLARPGWDEFIQAALHADRFLAEHRGD